MAYFPMMIDLSEKTCLLIGGGTVAAHKLRVLADYGLCFRVVAPVITNELLTRIEEVSGRTMPESQTKIEVYERAYEDTDLEGADLVIVAVRENPELGTHIYQCCTQRGIPVNVVDDPEKSSFIFPAIVKQNSLLVAVSTGGKSPTAAAILKQRIADRLPDQTGQMIDRMGELRGYVLAHVEEQRRKEVFKYIFEYMETHGGEVSEKELERICQSKK